MQINSNEHYTIWAPDDSVWSAWAKPVLFSVTFRGAHPPAPAWADLIVDWAPAASEKTAVILDLEDARGIWFGIALAYKGFRPVPLYNGNAGLNALLPVDSIVASLRTAADALAQLTLPSDAPPVFLLDARRLAQGWNAGPGKFDNRWAVFPQDFPSATFLLSRGIRSVVVAQSNSSPPQQDLAHVLLRWQEAGIRVLSVDVRVGGSPEPIVVTRPSRFRSLWYRALVIAGLRRNSAGGFGSIIPQPAQSSGIGSRTGFG